jgi:hypothetical protein
MVVDPAVQSISGPDFAEELCAFMRDNIPDVDAADVWCMSRTREPAHGSRPRAIAAVVFGYRRGLVRRG